MLELTIIRARSEAQDIAATAQIARTDITTINHR